MHIFMPIIGVYMEFPMSSQKFPIGTHKKNQRATKKRPEKGSGFKNVDAVLTGSSPVLYFHRHL